MAAKHLRAFAAAALSLVAPPAFALPAVGRLAPDFSVTTFDGKVISSRDLRGRVVILNFWATWCAPCRRELPVLDAFLKAESRHGLVVVAVTTEDSVEPSKLEPLQSVLAMRLARSFRGRFASPDALPTNIVIDRSGVVRYADAGAFSRQALDDLILPLLEEQAPDTFPTAARTDIAAR